MVYRCFYVSVTRLQFGEITKTINAVLRHDALEGAHVHENTARNVWHAPFPTAFSLLDSMLQICSVSNAFRHTCPPDRTVRNVWRALLPDAFSHLDSMLRICSVSYAFAHTCPPDHTVRNVWRASPFDSVGPLGPSPWPLGPPRPPKHSGMVSSSDRLGCQRRPGMPSEPHFVTRPTTSRPPVGFLP